MNLKYIILDYSKVPSSITELYIIVKVGDISYPFYVKGGIPGSSRADVELLRGYLQVVETTERVKVYRSNVTIPGDIRVTFVADTGESYSVTLPAGLSSIETTFADMAPAPTKVPWVPIGIGLLVVLGILAIRKKKR